MSDPNDLAAFLSDGWRHLRDGVARSDAPARFPTFATVAPDGTPEARTVALRAADQDRGVLEAHTDITTPKVVALRHNPVAALHIWVPSADLQIRLTARVTILTGPDVDAQWAKVPATSRVSYGTTPTPGTPIAHVYAYEKPALRDSFAVLECHLTHIDLVHLDTRHRRAAYVVGDNWQGTWLSP
ncbi:pyridoxamine 5'-phosphate oxidase family protein [Tateyamaria pelophila]|uniref:pyridoxamine 5'-phosphate oxidase family protein n=1 Tax=Tateyamaria pelophila TaxID=328415 RepID=UPI001CBD79DA|nr:pyridoxamine 5'-phosphate oxidase family protein [Tateyamaria pelophila]